MPLINPSIMPWWLDSPAPSNLHIQLTYKHLWSNEFIFLTHSTRSFITTIHEHCTSHISNTKNNSKYIKCFSKFHMYWLFLGLYGTMHLTCKQIIYYFVCVLDHKLYKSAIISFVLVFVIHDTKEDDNRRLFFGQYFIYTCRMIILGYKKYFHKYLLSFVLFSSKYRYSWI